MWLESRLYYEDVKPEGYIVVRLQMFFSARPRNLSLMGNNIKSLKNLCQGDNMIMSLRQEYEDHTLTELLTVYK